MHESRVKNDSNLLLYAMAYSMVSSLSSTPIYFWLRSSIMSFPFIPRVLRNYVKYNVYAMKYDVQRFLVFDKIITSVL